MQAIRPAQGALQGPSISPFLFCVYLDLLLVNVYADLEHAGVALKYEVPNSRCLSIDDAHVMTLGSVLWVDDLFWFHHSDSDLQLLRELQIIISTLERRLGEG
eukprot:4505979-Amphidinium_carterae.1